MATAFPGKLQAVKPSKAAVAIANAAPFVQPDLPPIEISDLLLEVGSILLGREPLSLDHDLYIFGHREERLHPVLADALLLVVDRRRRRIEPAYGQKLKQRPLFLIEKDDGRYVCGLCSVDGETLVIEPHPDIPTRSQRLRKEDSTPVGQVVAVVRKF